MTTLQFIGMLVTLVVSVELSIRVRWHSIDRMFARALMHGGSIDGAVRDALKAASEARANSDLAIAATKELQVIVDRHTGEIDRLNHHPILRASAARFTEGT